jgi:hypothetical protein
MLLSRCSTIHDTSITTINVATHTRETFPINFGFDQFVVGGGVFFNVIWESVSVNFSIDDRERESVCVCVCHYGGSMTTKYKSQRYAVEE